MSRKLFEYYFTPDELEPYYSELTGAQRVQKRPSNRAKKTRRQNAVTRSFGTTSDKPLESQSAESQAESAQIPTHKHEDEKRSIVEDPQSEQHPAENLPEETASATRELSSTEQERPPIDEETVIEQRDDHDGDWGRTRVRNMVSVHALGQYVFCPRAAILAAERGDQRDLDEPLPRLTYLPNFELERIEEELAASFKQLLYALVLVVALPVSMILSLHNKTPSYFYFAAAALFLALLWSADLLVAIVKLAVRRATALKAEAREPQPSFEGTEPVNWWSMLNAGFEPIRYQRPFQHPELPLEGCPWRVLQKGSLRIPVTKAGGDRLGNQKDTLFPKHEIRLVAYALLLEADGHSKVPYGLVFPTDSPHGLAFAITEKHRRRAIKLLGDFEKQLNDSQQRNLHPGLPDNRNRCANCEYGKPVATSIREVNSLRKAGEEIVILQSRSDKLFHCACGDRFGSAPPHRDTVRMGLRAILQ